MSLTRTPRRRRGPAGFALGGLGMCLALACLHGSAGAEPADGAASGNQIRLDRPPGERDGGPNLRPSAGGPATMVDVSPEETQRIFQNAGFDTVRRMKDEQGGTDYLRLRAGDDDSFLFHMNCTAGRCRSLLFTAFLSRRRGASLDFVNAYNTKTLHTKMSRNAAGEIVLTMAASLDGGVTAEHLRSLGPFWTRVHRDALAWK